MEFAQKRMATQTWFTFGERELKHRVRDNSGEIEFSVEYGAIPAAKRAVFNRNNWLRNVGLLWCVLGVVMIGLDVMGGSVGVGSGFWVFIGLGCLAFYRLTWSEFTVLDTSEGSIWIVRDQQHDAIMSAIGEKRTAHLLAWYRSFDFADDPQREIHTIEWLMKQDAMSKVEGAARIADIRRTQTILISHKDDEPGPQVH
jgi:hypothetical protein